MIFSGQNVKHESLMSQYYKLIIKQSKKCFHFPKLKSLLIFVSVAGAWVRLSAVQRVVHPGLVRLQLQHRQHHPGRVVQQGEERGQEEQY